MKFKVGDWIRFKSWVDGRKRWARVFRLAPIGVEWGFGFTSSVHSREVLEVGEPQRVDAGPRTQS
jgi:hypothetical protein